MSDAVFAQNNTESNKQESTIRSASATGTAGHGETVVTTLEGAEAQEFMNKLLMEITETDNMQDAHNVLVGALTSGSTSRD